MSIKSTLIRVSAVGALSLLGVAGASAAHAADAPLVFPNAEKSGVTMAAGTTASIDFSFIRNGESNAEYLPGPDVSFTVGEGATFPGGPVYVSQWAPSTSTWLEKSEFGSCSASSGGKTLTCKINANGAGWGADSKDTATFKLSTNVTVDANAPVGKIPATGALNGANVETAIAVTRSVPTEVTVDNTADPSVISGKGTPGATMIATDSTGKEIGTTTVGTDGSFTLTPTEQPTDGIVNIHEVIDGVPSDKITTEVAATPIIEPLIAGGAVLALFAAAGATGIVRARRQAHTE